MRAGQVVRDGGWAGAAGALVMILGQAIARLGAGVPMFPDLFEDAFTRAIPPAVFARVLDTLKFQAKPLLFVGILALQIAVGVAIGIGFAVVWGRERPGLHGRWPGWSRAMGCAVLAWLVVGLVLLPAAGDGIFGATTAVGPIGLNLALLINFGLFGLALAGTYRVVAIRPPEPADAAVASPERRRLLGGMAVGAVAVLAGGATYRIISGSESGPNLTVGPASSTGPKGTERAPAPTATVASVATARPASATAAPAIPTAARTTGWVIAGLPPEVTPTKDFYVVSKNFFSDPVIDPRGWSLQIGGLVKKPYTLSYDQLLKLPYQDRYQTLECISNEIGGNLISTAHWRGVSLHDLIAAAEPDPKTVKVVFYAADGYSDSLPFERAMSPANLLAYLMNGEPLVPGHGAPARLLIPGIYGMKNVKWLTKIQLVEQDFQGYWEQRGWSDRAVIQTMSEVTTIDSRRAVVPAGPVELAGVAFAGDRGISKVEVSVDGGKTWRAATLKDPLGPYTWRLWRLAWDATPGDYTIVVRATDGTGQVQTSRQTDTLPNGATGWDRQSVHVG